MKYHALNKKFLLAAIVAGAVVSSCGVNPFGSGEAGYKVFANLGKAISKPSQINDQQGSKADSKAAISQAQEMGKSLAKSLAVAVDTSVVTGRGIDTLGNGQYVYWETVVNKPSEEDAEKLMTGRGMVTFAYNGPAPAIGTIDTALITSINSFEFIGREHKTWRLEIDSLRLKITFLDNSWTDRTFKPGLITAWGKNISQLALSGRDDTASFTLDSLDDVNHIQYGEGHFLDAHTGRANDGEPRGFNFLMKVIHKNTVDPTKPYLRYQDNEGVIDFALQRAGSDSLYFSIRFFEVHKREGTIRKTSATGPIVATFTYNDKTGVGEAVYYNDDEKVIGNETL
jgi:hypothetical protein